MKKAAWLLIIACISTSLRAEDSRLLAREDVLTRRAEELFLSAWTVPPVEDLPLAAGDLRRQLERLSSLVEDASIRARAAALLKALSRDDVVFDFMFAGGAGLHSTSETDRYHFIQTVDRQGAPVNDVAFLDYLSVYTLSGTPSFYSLGAALQLLGLAVQVQADLNSSYSFLLTQPTSLNFPNRIQAFSPALPARAMVSFFSTPFEFRIGRGGLKIGPGTWGSMVLNSRIPYFDHLKARLFVDTAFSLSLFVINLNPIISTREQAYLQDMYDGLIPNPEVNADANGKPFIGAAKNLILSRLTVTPFPWLSFTVTQTNLVGGRDPILADLIPLNIFHNLFAEGVYSCPLSITATVVPYRGIKVYGEFFLQDIMAGDETDPTVNPGAAGYQAGLVLLSTPFFSLGPGRFRLNVEWSYVDPWVYLRYYSVRQYTSRIVYWDPEAGDTWIEYPLGFYLGPDALDVNVSLSYGVPGEWEIELWWNMNGLGKIDIFGWGEDSDFSHVGEPGYPLSAAPTPTAQWTNTWRLSVYVQVTPRLKAAAWYMMKYVVNRFHAPGDNRFSHALGIQLDYEFIGPKEVLR